MLLDGAGCDFNVVIIFPARAKECKTGIQLRGKASSSYCHASHFRARCPNDWIAAYHTLSISSKQTLMGPVLFYLGVFLISFDALALEIVQTRILSVVFWYHLAVL